GEGETISALRELLRRRRVSAPASSFDAVGLDLVVKRLPADAETFGGLQLVPAGFLEHLDNGVALDALQQREAGVAAGLARGGGDGQVGAVHDFFLAKQ